MRIHLSRLYLTVNLIHSIRQVEVEERIPEDRTVVVVEVFLDTIDLDVFVCHRLALRQLTLQH